jgi:hypothetical protein
LIATVAAALAVADTHGTVTVNTSALASSASGPFTLDLQFIEGNGAGDSNNTVTLSNFSLGGGSIVTPAVSTTGGVTVSASPLMIVLVDSSFFQDVQFSFTPGSVLSFQYDSTSNADIVAPDTFTLAILDNTGNEIPTNNPNGLNSFVELDLPTTGSGTQIATSNDTSAIGVSSSSTIIPSCDVKGNPTATVSDVQSVLNQSLGIAPHSNDVNGDGVINVVDIQLVINAALGKGCPVS